MEIVLQSLYLNVYEIFWLKESLCDPIYMIHVAAFY